MITCRRATELLSLRRERRLSLMETISLLWHLRVCPPCRYFARQIGLLGSAIKAQLIGQDESKLSDQRKLAIKQSLDKKKESL